MRIMFNVGVGILFRGLKMMGFVIKTKCRREKNKIWINIVKNKKSKKKPEGTIAVLL